MEVTAKVRLSLKGERFVYLLGYGLAVTTAARMAGWSVGYAHQLVRKPQIRAALLALSTNTAAVLSGLDKPETVQ